MADQDHPKVDGREGGERVPEVHYRVRCPSRYARPLEKEAETKMSSGMRA